jgi:hypothetical protein
LNIYTILPMTAPDEEMDFDLPVVVRGTVADLG